MDVLFIVKNRYDYTSEPGTSGTKIMSYGLQVSAGFVSDFLRSYGYTSAVETAVDGNSVDRIVFEQNPKIVILEALWCPISRLQELMALPRHSGRTWIVRLHSRIMFIANEGMAFEHISALARLPGLIIAPNVKEFADDIRELYGVPTAFLPNIYFADDLGPVAPRSKQKAFLDVGCFGAIRPLKNTLGQAISSILFANRHGKRLKFHVNGGRLEQGGANVYKNLVSLFKPFWNHQLISHDWTDHAEFIQLVRSMDLCLQISATETFNLTLADAVANGIPVVGSKSISWLPEALAADPESTEDMVEKITFSYWKANSNSVRMAKAALAQSNGSAKSAWLHFVSYTLSAGHHHHR